ncbi:MAG: hypothetical protein JWN44_5587, partial [Myxococcales bacterium]|nr:hypothetical protein [Myxococcales bacterium]
MRAGWQCPSCQGGASWNVRREGGSALETSICAACGYTAWYSGAAGQLEMQRVFNEHYRCLECGGDELHVEGTSDEADAAARLGARLGMAVVICACGRCDWMRAAGGH